MSNISSMPFARDQLPHLFALITFNALARWPDATYLMNSDVAWRLPGSNPKSSLRLWYDNHELVGYAWFQPNFPIGMDVKVEHPSRDLMMSEMLGWLEIRRRETGPLFPWLIHLKTMQEWEQALDEELPSRTGNERFLQISVLEKDQQRIQFLQSKGYEATAHYHVSMARSLETPIPRTNLPEGTQVRHVLEPDFPERVATHRDAWHRSSFDMRTYLGVRDINIFKPELDLVAEMNDGTFASYCIGWIDKELSIGSFEPVGTRPEFRRSGFGKQVNLEGLRRMKAMGMHSAKIGTAGFNNRAFGLYTACGFELIDRERTFIKNI